MKLEDSFNLDAEQHNAVFVPTVIWCSFMIILFVVESNVLHMPTSQRANELCEATHKQWFEMFMQPAV